MESLASVEKECEKTTDLFDSFYNDVDRNVSKVLEYAISAMSELSQSKFYEIFFLSLIALLVKVSFKLRTIKISKLRLPRSSSLARNKSKSLSKTTRTSTKNYTSMSPKSEKSLIR
jgi:hypothetical protein